MPGFMTALLAQADSVPGSHFSLATAVASGTATRLTGAVNTPNSAVFADSGNQVVVTVNSTTVQANDLSTPYVAPGNGGGNPLPTNANTITLAGSGGARLWKFSPDGLKAVCWRESTLSRLESYTLTTPYLLSSATLTSFSTASGLLNVYDISIDGLHFISKTGATIQYRSLSVAWDVSTLSAVTATRTTDNGAAAIVGVAWSGDGLRFYVGNNSIEGVREYSMTVAFDVTSSTGNNIAELVTSALPITVPVDISFSPGDADMLVSGHSVSGGRMQSYTQS